MKKVITTTFVVFCVFFGAIFAHSATLKKEQLQSFATTLVKEYHSSDSSGIGYFHYLSLIKVVAQEEMGQYYIDSILQDSDLLRKEYEKNGKLFIDEFVRAGKKYGMNNQEVSKMLLGYKNQANRVADHVDIVVRGKHILNLYFKFKQKEREAKAAYAQFSLTKIARIILDNEAEKSRVDYLTIPIEDNYDNASMEKDSASSVFGFALKKEGFKNTSNSRNLAEEILRISSLSGPFFFESLNEIKKTLILAGEDLQKKADSLE